MCVSECTHFLLDGGDQRITYCVHTNASLLKATMLAIPPIMVASLNGMKGFKILTITPRAKPFARAKTICGPRPLHGDQIPASLRRWRRVPRMLDVMKTLSPSDRVWCGSGVASASSLTGR